MRIHGFDSKWVRLGVFSGLIVVWLVLVGYLWKTGRNQLGAAAIGAGPLALYSFYDEVVNKPIIKITGPITYEKSLVRGHVDSQTLTNHFDADKPVILSEPIEAVYPVIYANLSVTNRA